MVALRRTFAFQPAAYSQAACRRWLADCPKSQQHTLVTLPMQTPGFLRANLNGDHAYTGGRMTLRVSEVNVVGPKL